MRRILLLAALVFVAGFCKLLAKPEEGHKKAGNDPAVDAQLSSQQQEVWNEEQNFFRYL
jgi:hypothetical protein